jgi:hypothetical protein
MRGGSTFLRHTCVAATAVTAHGNVHPLQWNMGSVHKYLVSYPIPISMALPRALRYAPRCVYMTPFGRPVVPEV